MHVFNSCTPRVVNTLYIIIILGFMSHWVVKWYSAAVVTAAHLFIKPMSLLHTP